MALDIMKILHKTPLAIDLTEEELAAIASCCRERRFPAGSEVFAEASPGREMYVLCTGRVSIEINIPSQPVPKTIQLAVAQPGMIFGEVALVDSAPRSARALARDEVTVLEISHEDLRRVMDAEPRIGYMLLQNLATILCERLRSTNLVLRNEWLNSDAQVEDERFHGSSHRMQNVLLWAQLDRK